MLPDYLVIGGVEILNTVRADAYGALLSACGIISDCLDCPGILDVINNGEAYDDVTQAPWYDVAIPESADVYGFAGLTVTGLDVKVWPNPGSADESPSGAIRDFSFTALITAGSECAMSYAIGWLASALNDPACSGGGCWGQNACMLACCPTDPDADVVRTVYGVHTVEGPDITRQVSIAGQTYALVTFTLRTAYPQIYREPIVYTIRPALGAVVDVNLPDIYNQCVDPEPCTTDPACPRPRVPGQAQVELDPCYPIEFTARRTLLSLPRGALPSGLDTVLVAELFTGAAAVRNFVLRVYNNPFEVDCARLPELNPCQACVDLVVTYTPPNGGLVIDGRTRTESVWCGSGQSRATGVPTIYGTPYKPFRHPVWVCGGATCIEILTDATVSADVQLQLSFVPRQEAA